MMHTLRKAFTGREGVLCLGIIIGGASTAIQSTDPHTVSWCVGMCFGSFITGLLLAAARGNEDE